MKCIKCGKPVSEEEFKARYDELCKQGIIPNMVVMCKNCRTFERKVAEAAIKKVYGE